MRQGPEIPDKFAPFLLGLLAAFVGGLAGQATYRRMRASMPEPKPWTPSGAFGSAKVTISDTHTTATRQLVSH